MSDHTVPSRFERSGSTVRFDHDGAPVSVTVCTSHIVRVELADERDVAGPSYVGPRSWAGSPFEILDGERVRLSTRRSSRRGGDEPAPADLSRRRGRLAA